MAGLRWRSGGLHLVLPSEWDRRVSAGWQEPVRGDAFRPVRSPPKTSLGVRVLGEACRRIGTAFDPRSAARRILRSRFQGLDLLADWASKAWKRSMVAVGYRRVAVVARSE